METQGPLATIWVGLGLCAFYCALIWVNVLLGTFLTPLFIIPLTWIQDRFRPPLAPAAPDHGPPSSGR